MLDLITLLSVIAYSEKQKITVERLIKCIYCLGDLLTGLVLVNGVTFEHKSAEGKMKEFIRIHFRDGDYIYVENNWEGDNWYRFAKVGDISIIDCSEYGSDKFNGYGVGLAKRRVENFDEEFKVLMDSYLKK